MNRYADKPVTFEVSVGNAGNSFDGYQSMEPHSDISSLDDNGNILAATFKWPIYRGWRYSKLWYYGCFASSYQA